MSKNTETAVYVRMSNELKAAIDADVERINKIVPGANVTAASWIRAACEARLKRNQKGNEKK